MPSFAAYVTATSALTLEDWQAAVCLRLETLLTQRGQRLLIHGPPQHGKSLIVSQRLPAYALSRRPLLRVRLACYNQTHAERFSTVNLTLLRDSDARALFPHNRAVVPERCRVEEWSTAKRAQERDANPSFKALGLGSGFTGLGVDLLIIDDPYKDRDDAYSEAVNASIWGWWTDVVLPRLNPATNVVVMFHRWHQDDFAGKLIDSGEWEQLRFPAIDDGLPDALPLDRPFGAALSPRYPLAYLERIRAAQGLSFQALYQGTPAPPSGNMFNPAWFTIVDAAPREGTRARYWDLAGASAGRGDYTVGVLMVHGTDGRWCVEDVERFQLAAHLRNARIVQVAELDDQRYGQVPIIIEQPPGLAKEATEALIRELSGFVVEADLVHRDKATRAEPFASQAQAGNVSIVRGAWNRAYLEELALFPAGTHDDQPDGSSGAFNWLAEQPHATSAPAVGGSRPILTQMPRGFR